MDDNFLELKEYDETKTKSKAVGHMAIIKKDDEYGTPNDMYWKGCKDYKINPKIDVCASKELHAISNNYLTIEDNFLETEVTEDAFMNPPYSDIYRCMERAYQQYLKYNRNWLILTFNKTDTRFWHNFVEDKAELHFIKGRIKFFKNGFKTTNSAPYGSVWIIYRRKGFWTRLRKRLFK